MAKDRRGADAVSWKSTGTIFLFFNGAHQAAAHITTEPNMFQPEPKAATEGANLRLLLYGSGQYAANPVQTKVMRDLTLDIALQNLW